MNYDRAAMKEEVKQALRRTRPHPMLVTLLFSVIVGAGAALISMLNSLFAGGLSINGLITGIMLYGEDYLENYFVYNDPQIIIQMITQMMFVSLLVSVLTTIWNGLMSAGYAGYCLDMSRDMNPDLGQIFSGFPRAGSVILAYILVAVFSSLWGLLFGFAYGFVLGLLVVLVTAVPSIVTMILFFLLVLAASVGYFVAILWVNYRYAMVPFAVIDSQNKMSAMEAIRVSKTIMKGRKGRFFVLQLSFIGWQLLKALIVVVGFVIVVAVAAGTVLSYANSLEDILSSAMLGGSDQLIQSLAQMLGPTLIISLLVALACSLGTFILDLWLTPYRIGSEARFYVYAMTHTQLPQPGSQGGQPGPYDGQPGPYGGQPIQPYGGRSGPYGGQSGSYGGQSGPYGGQSGLYGGQSGPYGGQSGPYGSQPGSYGGQSGYPYGSQSGSYGSQPGSYGGQSGYPYGSQSGSYGGQPGSYGGQPGSYGGQPGSYGGQPGSYSGQSGYPYGSQSDSYGGQSGYPYGSQSDSYGGQSGYPYGSQPGSFGGQPDPYGYTPPSQSSFGGYPQGSQPSQPDAGPYPQWGVPQAPEAPPAAPADPEPPAAPGGATVPLFAEEPDDSDPSSKPTIVFGDSDDNTPQQPGGPNYPQY